MIIMPILQRKKLRNRKVGNSPKITELNGIQARLQSLCPGCYAGLGTHCGSSVVQWTCPDLFPAFGSP